MSKYLIEKMQNVKLLLTDCDGVLTDGAVYYSEHGEELKKFYYRDGMGVERLRRFTGIEIGIITGENSPSVKKRAEKLKIDELHLGVKDKLKVLNEILFRKNLKPENVAYIGDDMNDLTIIKTVGVSACPNDAFDGIKDYVDYECKTNGGGGAFREFCEKIINSIKGEKYE
jgi:YrbI family 3-deoxy-D-manno-octulosonate 8-phosphate phosphatase